MNFKQLFSENYHIKKLYDNLSYTELFVNLCDQQKDESHMDCINLSIIMFTFVWSNTKSVMQLKC